MNQIAIALSALFLASCSAPTAPQSANTEKPAAAPQEAAAEANGCVHVGELYDLYSAKRDSSGWTEDDALNDLRARGEYSLGYVVDGVYGKGMFSAGDPGGALTRVDVLAACKRIAEGGSLY